MSNAYIFISTDGDDPEFEDVVLTDSEVRQLDLKIGATTVGIQFDQQIDLIIFCNQHNIPYTDERGLADG